MKRVKKHPDARREELLDAMQDLFVKKGFEKTSVQDIVKYSMVAQGTFYNYFKSKTDGLDALIQRFVTNMAQHTQGIINEKHVSAQHRMQRLINLILDFGGLSKEILNYIHLESNFRLHHMIEEESIKIFVPIFLRIIIEGNKNVEFHVHFPELFAQFITSIIVQISEELKMHLLSQNEKKELLSATQEFLEKVLSIQHNSIKLGLKTRINQ
jgi:AcrR family transcriptional regulator